MPEEPSASLFLPISAIEDTLLEETEQYPCLETETLYFLGDPNEGTLRLKVCSIVAKTSLVINLDWERLRMLGKCVEAIEDRMIREQL